MAGELTFTTPGLTGSTLYAILRNPANGQVRDVVLGAWEAWDDASIGDYDVTMTEQGASGRWLGTLPAGVTAPYTYEVCKRVGASPAVTDPVVGVGADVLTVAGIADGVWDEVLSGHATAGSTGAALDAASSASVLGSGSETIRIRCLNGATPVDGAAVWITSDEAGTDVVAGTVYTSATGYTAVLQLDPGTYWVWRQALRVMFDPNPEEITVVDA